LGFVGSIAGEEEEVGEGVFFVLAAGDLLRRRRRDGGERRRKGGVVEGKGDGWLQMCGQKFRGVICEE